MVKKKNASSERPSEGNKDEDFLGSRESFDKVESDVNIGETDSDVNIGESVYQNIPIHQTNKFEEYSDTNAGPTIEVPTVGPHVDESSSKERDTIGS